MLSYLEHDNYIQAIQYRIRSDKNMEELVLEEVNKSDNHKKLLFEVFQQRKDNERISSDPQLVFDDHIKFVEDHPYRYWFLVKTGDRYIGSVNISYENSLGIHLFAKYENFVGQLIHKICKTIKPLPKLASVRSGDFIVNISPKNIKLEQELEILGAQCIQKTFKLLTNEKTRV